MISSAKVFWVVAGVYGLVIFIPAATTGSIFFTSEQVARTALACALFIAGVGLGVVVAPFQSTLPPPEGTGDFRNGFATVVAASLVFALYVAIAGPPSPFFEALSMTDARAIAQMREDAVKLNADRTFVRLYGWGRDIFAPVAFLLSVQALQRARGGGVRAVAVVGILASAYLGLWSGQKATVVNYVAAAVIYIAADSRRLAVSFLKAAPVVLLVVIAMFWITLPELFTDPQARSILFQAIAGRVLGAPLDVATAYMDAVDNLRVIQRTDAIPYLSFLWSPGILSVENQVDIQYFYRGFESGHANALAFAYAYVMGGWIPVAIAGFVVVLGLRLANRIVAATGVAFLGAAFAAWQCYLLLDLINGNFSVYLLKSVAVAVLLWIAHALWPRLPAQSTMPAPEGAARTERSS